MAAQFAEAVWDLSVLGSCPEAYEYDLEHSLAVTVRKPQI